jgi:hypothetical protein
MKETEWAYLAGIIDGEGTIILRKQHSSVCPLISIAMTHKDTIDWIHVRCGGHVYLQVTGRITSLHHWVMDKYDGIELILTSTLPYMITKREQAVLMLEFLKECGKVGTGNWLTDEQRSARFWYKDELHKLNRPGHRVNED